MLAVSSRVGPDEIGLLGPVSNRVVTNYSAYIPLVYSIAYALNKKLADTNETRVVYACRNIVVAGSVLFLSAGLSFLSSQLGKRTFDAG